MRKKNLIIIDEAVDESLNKNSLPIGNELEIMIMMIWMMRQWPKDFIRK